MYVTLNTINDVVGNVILGRASHMTHAIISTRPNNNNQVKSKIVIDQIQILSIGSHSHDHPYQKGIAF